MDCDAIRDDQWERIKRLCPAGPRANAVREPATGFFWLRCYGWLFLVAAGVTCLSGWAITARSSDAIIAGSRWVSMSGDLAMDEWKSAADRMARLICDKRLDRLLICAENWL